MYSGKMIGYPDLKEDKLYPVYRPAEELEKAAKTFEGVPFIINHEMLGQGAVPYDQRPAAGTVVNVKYKDGGLWGDLKIWSEKMKSAILNGVKELSLGYKSVYERSRGVFNGQTYDFIQRNLRGNHLALVKNGRMGSDVRVYDANELELANTFDSIEFDITNKTIEKGNMAMNKDKESSEAQKTSDEFVSVEKLYAKFPESKEWIDANKYTHSPSKDEEQNENPEEKSDKGEDKTEVVKSDESKMGFITKNVNDGEVDKRKLIDEVGGILKGKVDEEIWRTVIGKIEKASYNKSESGKADDSEEKKEDVEKEKVEQKSEAKDGCGMDASEIRKSVFTEIRAMDKFYKKVLPFTGEFTYDEMESVEQVADVACKKLKIESSGSPLAAINGFLSAKGSQVRFTLDSNELKSAEVLDVKSKIDSLFS